MNMFKNIWAVVAGIITIVVLSIATDFFLEKIGFFPPISAGPYSSVFLAIALIYRTIYAYLGGYVTGKLAPNNPRKHVTILLIIGTVMGILGVIGGWNLSAHWYPISLVFTSAAGVWYGGKLGMKEKRSN